MAQLEPKWPKYAVKAKRPKIMQSCSEINVHRAWRNMRYLNTAVKSFVVHATDVNLMRENFF